MYFHPVFVLIPVLAITAVLGMSFAIVGAGNRKTWVFVLPVVIGVWYAIARMFALFADGALLPIFWGLALPLILCVTAWIFRRLREHDKA